MADRNLSLRIPIPFFADAMLGKLARWLRILGYDTAYERAISDEIVVDRTLRESRWLLTRDSYLVKRKALRGRHTLLTSDHPAEQLQQLRRELRIDLTVDASTESRCPICNLILESIPCADAAKLVPAFVASQHDEFSRCANCGRIYWPGTHWVHFLGQLDRLRN